MSMIAIKYQHSGAARFSRGRKFVFWSGLALSIAVVFSEGVGGLALLLIPILAWLTAPKHLLLGERYLICGGQIIYYANISQISLSKERGQLRLTSDNGRKLLIERGKFSTNARKTYKIAKNQADKFSKLSGKLISKIHQLHPDVEVIND